MAGLGGAGVGAAGGVAVMGDIDKATLFLAVVGLVGILLLVGGWL